jgi:undecaprenyl-diphosphatase
MPTFSLSPMQGRISALFKLQRLGSRARSLLPRESVILLAVLGVVLSLWAFAAIAGTVIAGRAQGIDERILISLRRPENLLVPIGPVWLNDAAKELSALGSATVGITVILAVMGYLALQRRFHMMVLVLGATLGGMLLSYGLKDLFARSRPTVVPHLVSVSSPSFPSGHSMLSAVVYLTLGALLARVTAHRPTKIYFLSVAVLFTVSIGLSRVYLGVHYPSDVLAGWAAGLLWALVCGLVAQVLQKRRVVEREAKS